MVYQSHVVSAGASANGGSSPPRAPSSSSAAKSEIPIRLSYQQRARHYDSLVDPFRVRLYRKLIFKFANDLFLNTSQA